MFKIHYCFLLFFCSFLYSQEQEKTLTVFFNSNDFSINSEAENTLNPFFLNQNTIVSRITIEGYCDDIGSDSSNLILSSKRANAVATFLQENFNIKSNLVEGKGEIKTNLSDVNFDEIRQKNRKAIVKITYSTIASSTKNGIQKTYIGYKKLDDKLKVGDRIVIENILFKGSLTHFIDEETAEKELLKIIKYLNDNPTVTIKIQGHVCCISKSFADARDLESGKNNLSETRAKKIYDFLLSKGIDKERMGYEGFGRQFPIPNTDELLNKRVEILITKI